MELDIGALARKLLEELNVEIAVNKARAEGVALLYDRIREAAEQHNQPVE